MIFKKDALNKNDLNDLLLAIKSVTSIDEETEYLIKLVCNELYLNIKNHSDADKIKFLAQLNKDMLTINFIDNSSGFKHDNYTNLDIADEERLYNESGRGICIVKSVSEEFSYNEKGNKVSVKIKIS